MLEDRRLAPKPRLNVVYGGTEYRGRIVEE